MQISSLPSYIASIRQAWEHAWLNKAFQLQFILAFFYMLSMAAFFRGFFDFIETRNGPTLNDIVLNLLPPTDVSWLVFCCLYTGIALGLLYMLAHPYLLLLTMETYCLVITLRIIAINLFPLNPPAGYIPLEEPVVALFVTDHRVISKDLFFSGHLATILSLYFAVRNYRVKAIVLFFAILVAFLLLLQHVHYAIDIVAAPVMTYIYYLIAGKIISVGVIKYSTDVQENTNYGY